jgi:hypothetical protein
MPLALTVKSTDAGVKGQREAAAWRVVAYFGDQLPVRRLLCFLGDEEWDGIENRGFYSPIYISDRMGDRPWLTAPLYVLKCVFADGLPVFEDFIYLHGSTCSNEVGLTMTLAHELQHFVQHSDAPGLWAANSLVPRLHKSVISALGLKWCDVPHERDARIVSKRVAENLLGSEAVRQYIDAKIAEFTGDADDWKCIQALTTSAPFDLARETRLFFPQLKNYRAELERVLRSLQGYSDFRDISLHALLDGAAK